MLEVAVCDDEILEVSYIEKLLERIGIETNTKLEVDAFYDGSTLVDYIKNGKRYDIIYLDIKMAKMNGVEAAKCIRQLDENVLLIYVSGYESYAKELFEVSAFRFITKPINQVVFKNYFIAAKCILEKNPKYFVYQYNKMNYRILMDKILYFQSERRVTYIITKDGTEKCYCKLNDIEKKLMNSDTIFYRTHQSFLVNSKYVKAYNFNEIELLDGTVLTISKNRRKKVSELYCAAKGEAIIV